MFFKSPLIYVKSGNYNGIKHCSFLIKIIQLTFLLCLVFQLDFLFINLAAWDLDIYSDYL